VVISARWVDLRQRGLGELQSTLKALSGLGVKTYVIGQSPMFTTDVQVIGFRQGRRGRDDWPISFDPQLNQRLAAIAATPNAAFNYPAPGMTPAVAVAVSVLLLAVGLILALAVVVEIVLLLTAATDAASYPSRIM